MDLLFGGDHGMGMFTFLFIVVVQYNVGDPAKLFEF